MSDSKEQKLAVATLGEYYLDALKVEAFLKERSLDQEANSLLCAKLYERTEARGRMVQYLAQKRGISVEEMQRQIIAGTVQPVSTEELAAVSKQYGEG